MRLWRSGRLLSMELSGEELFPRRLALKVPTARDLSDRFPEARNWIADLEGGARHYRLVQKTVNNRVMGRNTVPAEAWVDSRADALAWLGRQRDAELFASMVALTRQQQPELLAWLERRPLNALELAGDWPRLLAVVGWLRRNPRPGVYVRQVDLPGVDTKFIERHRGVLAELLDLVLPEAAVAADATGVGRFEQRYGFLPKPGRVRFRLLDPALVQATIPQLQGITELDLSLTAEAFAALQLPVEHVFITENEVNFLAFPPVRAGMVIFGSGYALELCSGASWLRDARVHYWGDIDTHGFAILDRLRAVLPHAESLLMDRATLEAHQEQWSREPKAQVRALPRLTQAEARLYDDL